MEKITTAVRFDPDEHTQLRVVAAQRRVSLQQALYEGAKMWLNASGLPTSPAMNGHARERSEYPSEHSHE